MVVDMYNISYVGFIRIDIIIILASINKIELGILLLIG